MKSLLSLSLLPDLKSLGPVLLEPKLLLSPSLEPLDLKSPSLSALGLKSLFSPSLGLKTLLSPSLGVLGLKSLLPPNLLSLPSLSSNLLFPLYEDDAPAGFLPVVLRFPGLDLSSRLFLLLFFIMIRFYPHNLCGRQIYEKKC
ncbi:hypothetical protein D3C72_2060790 [compost metagenome]